MSRPGFSTRFQPSSGRLVLTDTWGELDSSSCGLAPQIPNWGANPHECWCPDMDEGADSLLD